MNNDKTKITKINSKNNSPIILQREVRDEVQSFMYLLILIIIIIIIIINFYGAYNLRNQSSEAQPNIIIKHNREQGSAKVSIRTRDNRTFMVEMQFGIDMS